MLFPWMSNQMSVELSRRICVPLSGVALQHSFGNLISSQARQPQILVANEYSFTFTVECCGRQRQKINFSNILSSTTVYERLRLLIEKLFIEESTFISVTSTLTHLEWFRFHFYFYVCWISQWTKTEKYLIENANCSSLRLNFVAVLYMTNVFFSLSSHCCSKTDPNFNRKGAIRKRYA